MRGGELAGWVRVAGLSLTVTLMVMLPVVLALAQSAGVPGLDPARKVALSALCMIGPMTFAWTSMKADQASQHDNSRTEDSQHEIATDIRKAA